MFPFRFMPCPECGEAVEHAGVGHKCRAEPLLDVDASTPPAGGATFELEVHRYLDTPEGTFERWLAARRVRRSL